MKIENEEINNNYDVFTHLDKTDFRIVSLLVLGYDNKKISSTLKIPLSTIQRRTRLILQSGIVTLEYQPDFKLLGMKKGLLHTYLRDGQLRKTAEKVRKSLQKYWKDNDTNDKNNGIRKNHKNNNNNNNKSISL